MRFSFIFAALALAAPILAAPVVQPATSLTSTTIDIVINEGMVNQPGAWKGLIGELKQDYYGIALRAKDDEKINHQLSEVWEELGNDEVTIKHVPTLEVIQGLEGAEFVYDKMNTKHKLKVTKEVYKTRELYAKFRKSYNKQN